MDQRTFEEKKIQRYFLILTRQKKSCIWETLNLSTCTDSSTDKISFYLMKEKKKLKKKKQVLCVRCHVSGVISHIPPVTCHVSHVIFHMSCFTCPVSHVTCHMSHFMCHCHLSHVMSHMLHVTCHMLLMPTATAMGPPPYFIFHSSHWIPHFHVKIRKGGSVCMANI